MLKFREGNAVEAPDLLKEYEKKSSANSRKFHWVAPDLLKVMNTNHQHQNLHNFACYLGLASGIIF